MQIQERTLKIYDLYMKFKLTRRENRKKKKRMRLETSGYDNTIKSIVFSIKSYFFNLILVLYTCKSFI